MRKTAARLTVRALENIGVRYTFGIPGVHNIELYDELNRSKLIHPVLVTHEMAAAFMADAISRTTDSIGTLAVVPAAGLTHAMSGIGEAWLDGIAMLVISGGVRTDIDKGYQLHELDQHELLKPLTKATYKITSNDTVTEQIHQAWLTAISDEPGPVYVELPANLQLKADDPGPPSQTPEKPTPRVAGHDAIEQAVALLGAAQRPGIFAGWGAAGARAGLIDLAERLGAPVATTLQGLSVFPANHPLHTGMGMGQAAVPAAENAFADCDCLLAIGVRFSEIPTGSYGISPPKNLIHLDINPAVFNRNYPAAVTLHGDAAATIDQLLKRLPEARSDASALTARIARDKTTYLDEWLAHDSADRVNPAIFFKSLRDQLQDDAIVVADDGNHTFLAAELMPIYGDRGFLSPSDFNSMGYCVPAVNACKLAHPDRQVVGIVGDGAFLMSGMETLTARTLDLGSIYFIFNDGELSQIAQAQEIPYNRKTCTVLKNPNFKLFAAACGAEFVRIQNNTEVDSGISAALAVALANRPVIVDVHIDYSKRTRFTKGVVKTNLKRFGTRDKLRIVSRALARKITG
jgi:acetolactate synthase I/II/III large subunit